MMLFEIRLEYFIFQLHPCTPLLPLQANEHTIYQPFELRTGSMGALLELNSQKRV